MRLGACEGSVLTLSDIQRRETGTDRPSRWDAPYRTEQPPVCFVAATFR